MGAWQECIFWCCLEYSVGVCYSSWFVVLFNCPISLLIFFLLVPSNFDIVFFKSAVVIIKVSVFSFYSVSFCFKYVHFFIFLMDWSCYHYKHLSRSPVTFFVLKSILSAIKNSHSFFVTLCMVYIFLSFHFHSISFFEPKMFFF